jgi:hypothetical protein
MSTFTDDFERGDGGLANDWYVYTGTFTIASGNVSASAAGWAYNGQISADGRQDALVTFTKGADADVRCGAFLKMTSAHTGGYACYGFVTGGVTQWHVRRVTNSNFATDITVNGALLSNGQHIIRFLYDGGILTLWVDGQLILTGFDDTYDAESLAGIYANAAQSAIDAFTLYGNESVGFSIDPGVVGNYGECVELTLTGAAGNWTPGTPGSPTFTVNHGTISAQTVNSSTSATLTYCPGAFLGTATFTDPTSGQTATVTVTSDTEVVPPADQCPFDEDFVTTANATVLASNRGLPTLQSIIVPAAEGWGNVYLQEAIMDLWYSHFRPEGVNVPPTGTLDRVQQLWLVLNGGYEVPTSGYDQPSAVPVVQMLEALGLTIDDIRTVNDWTLGSVINEIRGTSNRTVTEVYDLVDALEAGSNDDVLLWLNTYLGTTGPTLAQLGTMISDLATIAGYDLGDVLDAIAAIPGVDLTPITNKLTAIQPNAAYTLSTIAAQGDGLASSLGTINDKLDALADAVAAIPTDPVTGGAPVWPGVGDATLGTPAALTAQLVLDGPMHGVLVNVTVPPTHSGRISLGGQIFDYKSGEIAFVSDNGFIEPWQYIGWRQGLYTPKRMSQASSALFRILSGCEGTARTFMRS